MELMTEPSTPNVRNLMKPLLTNLVSPFILLKKFQRTSGSVDEKLATFPFKIREYKRLLAPIDYDLVYMYLLPSDWFNAPKYQDYYDYMDEFCYPYCFNSSPLSAIGL